MLGVAGLRAVQRRCGRSSPRGACCSRMKPIVASPVVLSLMDLRLSSAATRWPARDSGGWRRRPTQDVLGELDRHDDGLLVVTHLEDVGRGLHTERVPFAELGVDDDSHRAQGSAVVEPLLDRRRAASRSGAARPPAWPTPAAASPPSTNSSMCARRANRPASCSTVKPIAPWFCTLSAVLSLAALVATVLAAAAWKAASSALLSTWKAANSVCGTRGVHPHRHVGASVLDGLERADRLAELVARLGVLDRHRRARRRRCRAPWPRRAAAPAASTSGSSTSATAGPELDPGEAHGRVDARSRRRAARSRQISDVPVAVEAHDEPARLAVERRSRRPARPARPAALEELAGQLARRRQLQLIHPAIDRRGERARCEVAAELGEEHDLLDRPAPHAAERGGDAETEPAHVGAARPRCRRRWRAGADPTRPPRPSSRTFGSGSSVAEQLLRRPRRRRAARA